eukprot:2087277-Rhodomonas_salina.2
MVVGRVHLVNGYQHLDVGAELDQPRCISRCKLLVASLAAKSEQHIALPTFTQISELTRSTTCALLVSVGSRAK